MKVTSYYFLFTAFSIFSFTSYSFK